MTPIESIESKIRDALRTETRAVRLSAILFDQQTGLFGKLAADEAGRRAVAAGELFRTAQRRLRELQFAEADALRAASARFEQPVGV